MEFKGSNGTWKKVFLNDGTRAIRNEGGIIIRFWNPFKYTGQYERYEAELKETQANQQITSKAPELLECLKGLVSDVDNLLGEYDIEWQQAGYLSLAKELIKEATEL